MNQIWTQITQDWSQLTPAQQVFLKKVAIRAGVVLLTLLLLSFGVAAFFVTDASSGRIGFTALANWLILGGSLLLWKGSADFKRIGKGALYAGLALAVILYVFGPRTVSYWQQTAESVTSGQGVPPAPPLSAEEQAARLERERQETEVARVRAVAEAAARTEAEEADRLARQVTSQLPQSVRVPHCSDGWSQPVIIPGGWRVRSSWTGRVNRTQYLNEGVWRDATTLTIPVPVEAFRYCTTSRANLSLDNGNMSLVWRPY